MLPNRKALLPRCRHWNKTTYNGLSLQTVSTNKSLIVNRYERRGINVGRCYSVCLHHEYELIPWGGGYSVNPWVGRCGPAPHTAWTCFRQKSLILLPCLRHLTRNHTLCKTITNIETRSYLIHWQSQNYLQLDQQSHAGCLSSKKRYPV